jgi:hypothetical protein
MTADVHRCATLRSLKIYFKLLEANQKAILLGISVLLARFGNHPSWIPSTTDARPLAQAPCTVECHSFPRCIRQVSRRRKIREADFDVRLRGRPQMRNPGSLPTDKLWQTVWCDFSDAEQMEALAILPLVLMAQIQCIKAPGGEYHNVARRVGSAAKPRRRPLCIMVPRKTLHLQVLRVIACRVVIKYLMGYVPHFMHPIVPH